MTHIATELGDGGPGSGGNRGTGPFKTCEGPVPPVVPKITSYTARLMGVPNLQDRIKTQPVNKIQAEWQPLLEKFKALRAKYLLYPESGKAPAPDRKLN